jgi:type VI secretion system protein ImpJ
MKNRPVHWSEGMFLRPQHFQAWDRYWAESLASSSHWNCHYDYGLRRVEISREALARYQVEIVRCQARMQDGTLLAFEIGQEPDRAELKPPGTPVRSEEGSLRGAFENQKLVRVYLAVPRTRMGQRNVAVDGPAGNRRFVESRQELADESAGGNEQEVAFREPNIRILLSTEDRSGYETLPIAQIRIGDEEGAVPVIDDEYFPPMLAVDAWPPLSRNVIRDIYDFLCRQLQLLRELVVDRGISLASQEPGEVDKIFKLMVLNEACTVLRVLTFAEGVHPFVAYGELCRIVAKLAVFSADRQVADVPLYDHDDLATIFLWVKTRIEEAFRVVAGEMTFEQRYFEGYGQGMRVDIDPKWLFEDWQWYIGVAAGDLTERECRKLLEPGYLNWKMGSEERIDSYWRRRAAGLELVATSDVPRVLPTKGGWVYYEVNKDSPAFADVKATHTLAMRFAENYIQNLDDLDGKRDLVIAAEGRRANLQFALFAVKRR